MPLQKIALAVLAMTIFGLNAVVSKIGLGVFPPLLFNLLRFSIVLPCIFFIPRPPISWGMLIAITLSLSIGHLMFANIGLFLGASAGTYVLIQQSGSIFAILCAYLLFSHRPSRYDVIGMAFGIMGIICICSAKGTEGTLWAIAALVASAATWGIGFTLVKKAHAPSVPTTVWSSILVIPLMTVASLIFEGPETIWSSLGNGSILPWMTVVFSGWISMMGAGGILMYLMRTELVSKVAPFNMLVPVTGCLFSVLILGEQLSLEMIGGGMLIILGLAISQFGAKLKNRMQAALIRNKSTTEIEEVTEREIRTPN